MDLLPLNFRTLWLCGIWYEKGENFNVFRKLYRAAVIIVVFYFTFTLVAFVFAENGDMSELMEGIFLAVTYATLCLKIVNFASRRDEVNAILDDLRSSHCRPVDSEESEILVGYSRSARRVFIGLMALVMSDISYFFSSFLLNVSSGSMALPYHTYQLYNASTYEILIPTACYQFVAVIYSVSLNIAFDTMTAGLMILITGQLELNAHRLRKLGKHNDDKIDEFIAHNVLINGVVEKIESLLIGVTIVFMFFGLMSIVASAFQLSQYSIFSMDFVGMLTFVGCMLAQILVYCWFGNEMKLKRELALRCSPLPNRKYILSIGVIDVKNDSEAITNAVYHSDWISLSPPERKKLYFMMVCNKDGRIISYGGQCSFTLETFVWILKTSYGILNLLHRVNT